MQILHKAGGEACKLMKCKVTAPPDNQSRIVVRSPSFPEESLKSLYYHQREIEHGCILYQG